MKSKAQFPEKLKFLFKPHRYKVAYGGRGSGKSWGFARALLILGIKKKLRILCAREVQDSIKQSVHKLLGDQIELLKISSRYQVLDTIIRGKNGTEIMFTGLSTLTVDSIKSFEGVDIVWVEEGQVITERSWKILVPTIRKDDSEIWVSYNPELETDPTHDRFVTKQPQDAVVVKMNYSDNPFFNTVMEKERIECQKNDPKGYPNIWEGECRPAVEGAIYHDGIQKAENNKRVCNVPYDPYLKVHVVFDLGWNDSMGISLVQRHYSEIRIIEYIEDSHKTLDHYSAELKKKNLNWGKVWLPHDGYSGDYKTGKTTAQIMKKFGWRVPKKEEIVKVGVEEGIKITRMAFGRMVFDKVKAARLVECIKRYRRHINKQTGEPGAPVHDEFSHGADNLRYISVNADKMTNEDQRPVEIIQGYGPMDAAINY